MTLSTVTNQRTRDKFEENSEGKTAVRTIPDASSIVKLQKTGLSAVINCAISGNNEIK